VAIAFFLAAAGAHLGEAVEVAHEDADQLLRRQRLREQLLLEGGDICEQALGNRRDIVEIALLEQRVFEAMETDKGRILLALFEIIGAGIDVVVQLGQTLRRRRQTLIGSTRRQVQRLRLRQITTGDRLIQRRRRFDQRAALNGQIHAKFRQRPDESHHRGLGLGGGIGSGCRCDVQGAARVAEQAASDRIVARLQVGVDHLAQARRDVFPLFDHQHAVENFPLDRTLGAVDDAETGAAGRHRQGIRLATVWMDVDDDFVVVVLTLGGGHVRGVPEQPAGGDHQQHRAGQRPTQGRRGLGSRHEGPYWLETEVVGVAWRGAGMKNITSASSR